jgi:hypothetical protein
MADQGSLPVQSSLTAVSLLEAVYRWASSYGGALREVCLAERRGQTSLERHECGRREAVWRIHVSNVEGANPIGCSPVVRRGDDRRGFLVRRRRMPESNLKNPAIGAGPNTASSIDGIRAHNIRNMNSKL